MLSPSTRATDLVADELLADDERLREAVGRRLAAYSRRMPSSRAVAEQRPELGLVLRRRDDEDLADAGHHERRQRVIDHRLVVDGHELLRDALGDRPKPRAGAAGEDDAAHVLASRVRERSRHARQPRWAIVRLAAASARPGASRSFADSRGSPASGGNTRPSSGSSGLIAVLVRSGCRCGDQVAHGRVVGERDEAVPESLGEVDRAAIDGVEQHASPTGRMSASRRGCRRRSRARRRV